LTRDDFITELRTRIYEDTADVITDTQIQALIKQGNYNIAFETGLLPEYATVSADASGSYTLPADMVKLSSLYYVSADSPPVYTLLIPYNLQQIQEDGFDSATMKYYVRNGQQIEIFGSTVTTGTLRAYGVRIPTNPATGGSYIDLPDQYLELMYLWCEWKYYVRRRIPDESALARDMYLSMVKAVSDQVEQQYERGVTAYG
jgi:hypothetical protein